MAVGRGTPGTAPAVRAAARGRGCLLPQRGRPAGPWCRAASDLVAGLLCPVLKESELWEGPSIPVEKKTRVVLSVLAGNGHRRKAARREKVVEAIHRRWASMKAGKTALAAGKSGPSSREAQLEAEVAEADHLGEAGRDPGVEEVAGPLGLLPTSG